MFDTAHVTVGDVFVSYVPVALAALSFAKAWVNGRQRDQARDTSRRLVRSLHADPEIPVEKVREIEHSAGLGRRVGDLYNTGNGQVTDRPTDRNACNESNGEK